MRIPWDRKARSSVCRGAIALLIAAVGMALFADEGSNSLLRLLAVLALAVVLGGLIGYFEWFLKDHESDRTLDYVSGRVDASATDLPTGPFTIRMRRLHTYLIWGGLIGFGLSTVLLAVWSIQHELIGLGLVAILGGGITAMFLSVALFYGKIEMDDFSIRLRCPAGAVGISWDEIDHVGYDVDNVRLLLQGSGKSLPNPGPGTRAGPNVEMYRHYLFSHLQRRGVEIRSAPSRIFQWPKNARINPVHVRNSS